MVNDRITVDGTEYLREVGIEGEIPDDIRFGSTTPMEYSPILPGYNYLISNNPCPYPASLLPAENLPAGECFSKVEGSISVQCYALHWQSLVSFAALTTLTKNELIFIYGICVSHAAVLCYDYYSLQRTFIASMRATSEREDAGPSPSGNISFPEEEIVRPPYEMLSCQ